MAVRAQEGHYVCTYGKARMAIRAQGGHYVYTYGKAWTDVRATGRPLCMCIW